MYLAIQGYFGTNGQKQAFLKSSVDLSAATLEHDHLTLQADTVADPSKEDMNAALKYSSLSQSETADAHIIQATFYGYGYALPYGTLTIPSDLVRGTYALSVPKDKAQPASLVLTISSYDHPTLPPFYQATLTLVSGGAFILP